ncbi:hypothetical protein GCM10009117_10630 [Gangjinia marincola]|uniref:Uncharacterized protein n=2 Tax=Gangjinia marincola TaxID=578463 RepID=A0ABP3XRU2_9FLAO
MGCPAGQFYEYSYIGIAESKGDDDFTKIRLRDGVQLSAKVGYFVDFNADKMKGVAVLFNTIENERLTRNLINNIVSSKFGKLELLHDSPYIIQNKSSEDLTVFAKKLNEYSARQLNKMIINDSIVLTLKSGESFIFVYKK